MNKKLEKILCDVKKPARYTGGEYGAVYKDSYEYKAVFCFPDTYEIGMSHLGLRILYSLMNEIPGVWCQRAFAPWTDMEEKLKGEDIPLFALESGDPLASFDLLAFTLQYELSYTNVLNMLSLSKIPIKSRDRDEGHPLIIAGGPGAFNPEPMADFIDIFAVGEGEEITIELINLFMEAKGMNRFELLVKASKIPGVYVPALYNFDYNTDGTIKNISALWEAPEKIVKRIVRDFDSSFFPTSTIVPSTEVVHDRVSLELFRGCIRGCRFCQAGHTSRPVRRRSADKLIKQGIESIGNSGYEEISLVSLSTSDYKELFPLLDGLCQWGSCNNVSVSVPSLRADSFSPELMDKLGKIRKSGLTFAPEAGSQRLRDVINKNISEEEILKACQTAFESGRNSVKLYFMLGLPTETDEDLEAIGTLARKIQQVWKEYGTGISKRANITISCACFVPKPHTPFQWEGQTTVEEFRRKQDVLKNAVGKGVKLNWHDAETSFLEGAISRGDRRLCAVIEKAWESGCRLDGWSECFMYENWLKAFELCGIDPGFYTSRKRGDEEIFPWEWISAGEERSFLASERDKAYMAETTPDCGSICSSCGASGLLCGGRCDV